MLGKFVTPTRGYTHVCSDVFQTARASDFTEISLNSLLGEPVRLPDSYFHFTPRVVALRVPGTEGQIRGEIRSAACWAFWATL